MVSVSINTMKTTFLFLFLISNKTFSNYKFPSKQREAANL